MDEGKLVCRHRESRNGKKKEKRYDWSAINGGYKKETFMCRRADVFDDVG